MSFLFFYQNHNHKALQAPGPTVMPAFGKSLGGTESSPTKNIRTQSSLSGHQPSTPDSEEVTETRKVGCAIT